MDHKREHVGLHTPLPFSLATNCCPGRDGQDPKVITQQILTIAPILPGQTSDKKFDIPPPPNNRENPSPPQPQPPPQKPADTGNLIEFGSDSRPPSVLPPTNNAQQKQQPLTSGLMDDDEHVNLMNDKMKDMKMHEPITPTGQKPLTRTDTDTSEVDAFFDAQN